MAAVSIGMKKLANGLSSCVFFLGLALMNHFSMWWPEIMLVIAAYILIRFGLQKKLFPLITGTAVCLMIYFGEKFAKMIPTLNISPLTIVFITLGIIAFAKAVFTKQPPEEDPGADITLEDTYDYGPR